jgi:hypothetical protein
MLELRGEIESRGSNMKTFFLRVALISGGIMASVAILGRIGGMRSARSFGDAYITLGGISWVIGVVRLTAGWRIRSSGNYQIARSVSVQNLSQRTLEEARDILSHYAALLYCAAIGTLVGGVGALLHFAFA